MTRSRVDIPIWTWRCDFCGKVSEDLAVSQAELPTPEEMEARGWLVSDFGDRCPDCRGVMK